MRPARSHICLNSLSYDGGKGLNESISLNLINNIAKHHLCQSAAHQSDRAEPGDYKGAEKSPEVTFPRQPVSRLISQGNICSLHE